MLTEAEAAAREAREVCGERGLSFSSAMRKARELGRRSLDLAVVTPAMVVPRASYGGDYRAVLVLQRGETATTAYYLRPRLQGLAVEYADMDSDPGRSALLARADGPPLLVILSRYVTGPWLRALEEARERLVRVAYFADDDLPAMMTDSALPATARGKVAAHYGRHVERLSSLASEVWLSTSVLAARYSSASPSVLGCLPDDDPAPPAAPAERLVVYHGTDVHGAEREFVLRAAQLLRGEVADAIVEITGGADLGRAAAGLGNVRVVAQAPWPEYLRGQRGRTAAISLAPLFRSRVNDARAPVKAFDAARLGAAALFAESPAYQSWVRPGEDGLLLPMRAEAWAAAIAGLLREPERRIALTARAAERLRRLRREPHPLPSPAGA